MYLAKSGPLEHHY